MIYRFPSKVLKFSTTIFSCLHVIHSLNLPATFSSVGKFSERTASFGFYCTQRNLYYLIKLFSFNESFQKITLGFLWWQPCYLPYPHVHTPLTQKIIMHLNQSPLICIKTSKWSQSFILYFLILDNILMAACILMYALNSFGKKYTLSSINLYIKLKIFIFTF